MAPSCDSPSKHAAGVGGGIREVDAPSETLSGLLHIVSASHHVSDLTLSNENPLTTTTTSTTTAVAAAAATTRLACSDSKRA